VRRALVVLLLVAGCTPVTAAHSTSGLLRAAPNGDGDSWKDTSGHEYRLGLINTPELNECYGQIASDERKHLVRKGFRADVYSKDTYGRLVAVVYLADGTNLNVFLARHGYANDRYLTEFRNENPSLARELDSAFAAARRERAGLWGACR
jgi:endonuclease YncB( thermonuclease family)